MVIDASGLGYAELNEKIRASVSTVKITGCLGQRFIGAGMLDKSIEIEGIPGNAMGAYLNGANITTSANAQDAVGDTMNDGSIVIRGTVGDAVGYAMRGGQIYVEKNAGYRAGIHMKEYKDKKPVIVIGGRAGSFLGEYQAGGIIIVLGLNDDSRPIVGNFPCTGMHGGKVFLRTDPSKLKLPKQVSARVADQSDMEQAMPYIKRYCELFGADEKALLSKSFTVITPDSKNPYKQMYVQN